MIAIDTNLLVYAHRSAAKEHGAAKRAIERAIQGERGCGVAVACIAEFWAVVTHPSSPRPSTPAEALDFVKSLVQEAGVEVWPQARELGIQLARAASDLEVRGSRVFDLQIALTALQNGATELWTHDRDFVSVPGLTVHDPLA